MPVKGSDEASTLLGVPKRVDVRYDGKLIPNGVMLWIVGSSLAKGELYGWLRQERPGTGEAVPTGWVHWPEYSEEWFQQLTAEELVVKIVRGFRKPEWVKTRERNEALDLHVYNRAAAAQIGIDRWDDRRWDMIRAELTTSKPPDPDAPPTTAALKVRPRRPGSGYWK